MPQVPVYSKSNTPLVSPDTSPLRGQQISVDSSMFGSGVAEAQAGVGKSMQGAGEQLFKRAVELQELNNQTEARDASNKFIEEMGQVDLQYRQLEGKAAVDGYQGHIENIKKIHEKYASGVSTDSARRHFLNDSSRQLTYNIINSSHWAAGQGKKYRTGVNEASIAIAKNNAAIREDDMGFQNEIVSLNKAVDAEAANNYWSPEVTQVKRDSEVSEAWRKRLANIAMTDPMGAQALYNKNKDQIRDATQRYAVEQTIQQSLMTHGAAQIAQQEVEGSTLPGYLKRLSGSESNGSVNARSKTSSAGGEFQFIKGTWRSVSERHPELGLTPEGRVGNKEQGTKAAIAFTKDNVGFLKQYGHDLTFQNLHTMHFFGETGGPRFLAGLQKDPNAPASQYASSSAVEDNPTIFYKKDGTMRTAREVYNILGNKIGGGSLSDGLTPNTTPGQFNAMAERVRARAETILPGNTEFADKAVSNLRTSYNLVKAQADDIRKAHFTYFTQELIGAQPGQGAKSLQELFKGSPERMKAYAQLAPEQQRQIQRSLEQNAKGIDPPDSEEAQTEFGRLLRMSVNDAEGFMKEIIPGRNLPRARVHELQKLQAEIMKGVRDEGTPAENQAMNSRFGELLQISATKPEEFVKIDLTKENVGEAELKELQRAQAKAMAPEDDKKFTQTQKARFGELLLMSAKDPQGFANLDLTGEDLGSESRLAELQRKQAASEIRANKPQRTVQGNKQLTTAFSQVKGELQPLGISMDPNTRGYDEDRSNAYVGVFSREINDFVTVNKRMPNSQEVREISAKIVKELPRGGDWWESKRLLIDEPVDKNFAAGIQKEYYDRAGREATEEEIRHLYMLKQTGRANRAIEIVKGLKK